MGLLCWSAPFYVRSCLSSLQDSFKQINFLYYVRILAMFPLQMDFIFLYVYCIHCCCANSMQQVLRETRPSADSQGISRIFWDQKFIKFLSTARHLFLPLSHINLLHALPFLFY